MCYGIRWALLPKGSEFAPSLVGSNCGSSKLITNSYYGMSKSARRRST